MRLLQNFRASITYENGKAVLHLELLKQLYVMLIVSLLLYQKLRKDLEAIGFKVNPYDTCVSNNMIWYKRKTMTWHVNDLKVSHDDKDIVDAFIQCTE